MKHQQFLNLKQVVDKVQLGQLAQAKMDMHAISLELQKKHLTAPDRTLYRLMLHALSKRMNQVENTAAANLYLREDDAIPQIQLFDVMASRFPLITQSRKIANAMLNDMIPLNEEIVTLFSIGIGSGGQEADFLKLLAQREQPPKRVQVVGLEPSAQSLELAQHTLTQLAAELGLSVEFMPILKSIEEIQDADWDRIRQLPGALLISESFALHHTGLDKAGQEQRDQVLRDLKALQPKGFVLIEPNSDHVTPDLDQRFENCWAHFSLVFRVIDELDVEIEVKEAIKRLFFGREIEDIIALEERQRHERHETVYQWRERLIKAGFVPHCGAFEHTAEDFGITTVQNYGTYIGLDVVGQTVVAVIGVK